MALCLCWNVAKKRSATRMCRCGKKGREALTVGLVLVEAEKTEAERGHAGVYKKGEGFVGAAEVGGGVTLLVGGESLGHGAQNGRGAEGADSDHGGQDDAVCAAGG